MIEHGISTTKAHYWVHLFPLLSRVFWYRVAHCRAYIALYKPVTKISETGTGAGFLIPQNAYFVSGATLPPGYVDHVDWHVLTDREAGLRGQEIAFALIEQRVVNFPPFFVAALNNRSTQNQAIDGQITWRRQQGQKFEIKLERARTANLFVQQFERGHQVHVAPDGTRRVSYFPTLFDEAPP